MTAQNSAVLLSGGIDSIALAAWKKPQICLTIDYGQRAAEAEVKASSQVCNELGLHHLSMRVDCAFLGCGDLVGTDQLKIAPASEWWPYRNQLLITLAAMRLLPLGVNEILFGAVRTDDFHKDRKREFFEHITQLLSSQEGGVKVIAPAIHMNTADLVRVSGIDSRLLAYAHSCHTGNLACGRCRGCTKHRAVMDDLGLDVY